MSASSARKILLDALKEGDRVPSSTLGTFIMALTEITAHYAGLVSDGYNLKRVEGGWFLVVRARRPGGERVVSYHAGATPEDCWRGHAVGMKAGILAWKPDRY